MIYPAKSLHGRSRDGQEHGYVSFRLDEQWLGVPVVMVQEVLTAQSVSPIPLAPAEVAGFLNLRGQIVTAIDLRARLGLTPRAAGASSMNVVVRDRDELFSLLVDEVGDVVDVQNGALEATPSTLDPRWRSCCDGVIRLPVGLLVVMSVEELLRMEAAAA
jgi:purine-binding chemotaxis protein CheW